MALDPCRRGGGSPTRLLAATALEVLPRVLGFCDREPTSATYGCCDRPYWHYRLIDVANARLQEAGWLLALAWAYPGRGNRWRGSPALAAWSCAIWNFWLSARNADGSVREIYPYERSFCATSFTAAAFTETVRLMGGAQAFPEELLQARSTFLWLGEHSNPSVFNQMAASLHALCGYASLTGDAAVTAAARRRHDEVRRLATPDGVLPEYGGMDAGYQTISLASLAKLAGNKFPGVELDDLIGRGLSAVADRIGPEGQVDAARNSRGTQFLYPSALARHAPELLERLVSGLNKDVLLRPAWMDDRYCIALAIDYLLASMELPNAYDDLETTFT